MKYICIDCKKEEEQKEYPSYKGGYNTGIGNEVLCPNCAQRRGYRVDDEGSVKL